MNERDNRGDRIRTGEGTPDESNQAGTAPDPAAGQDRRNRYPDEKYGGDPTSDQSADSAEERQSHRDRRTEANQGWRGEGSQGADYRGDFAPAGSSDDRQPGWDGGDRPSDARGASHREIGRHSSTPSETPQESKADHRASDGGSASNSQNLEGEGQYGFGSPYGQGDMGSDRAGSGDTRETDWSANRPARGRGTFAGDWALGSSGGTSEDTDSGDPRHPKGDKSAKE